MVLKISVAKVVRLFVLMVALLTLANLLVRFLRYIGGDVGSRQLLRFFDAGQELSLPTWYSSFTLLLCSGLLYAIAVVKRRRGDPYPRHWTGLSVIFLLLSLDESTSIHEEMGDILYGALDAIGLTPSGFLHFVWVVPAAIFVLVVLLTYVGFLAHLPGRTRLLFLCAGITFVLGAIGMEMLTARLIYLHGGSANWENVEGIPKIIGGTQTSIEELLEMSGVVIFIYSLLSYARSSVREVTVQIHVDDK